MDPKLDEKELDRMIEVNIDHATELERLKCMACEGGELDSQGYCDGCGGKTDL